MAVTAKFTADWQQFYTETMKAEKAMQSFQQQADFAGGRLMDLSGYSEKSGAQHPPVHESVPKIR